MTRVWDSWLNKDNTVSVEHYFFLNHIQNRFYLNKSHTCIKLNKWISTDGKKMLQKCQKSKKKMFSHRAQTLWFWYKLLLGMYKYKVIYYDKRFSQMI